jgi:hypothetical protein
MSRWKFRVESGSTVRYEGGRMAAKRSTARNAECGMRNSECADDRRPALEYALRTTHYALRTGRIRRARMLAAMIISFLCLGLISPILPGEPTHSVSAAGGAPPAPMPLISHGVPAYASSDRGNPASRANDSDYSTFWRSNGVPAWLAYDLSGVPTAQRGNVLLAWYNDPLTTDYSYTLTKSLAYNLPSSYTIEANSAAGDRFRAAAGWSSRASPVIHTTRASTPSISAAT